MNKRLLTFSPEQAQALIAFQESNAIEQEWDHDSLNDTIQAWNYLATQQELSKLSILVTHSLLMRTRHSIPNSLKGIYRTGDIYIANRKGTHPQHLQSEMNTWIDRQNELIRQCHEGVGGAPDDTVEVFQDRWAKAVLKEHVAYEIIHPFADGNGRTGRLFLNWTREQMGLPILVIWERTKCTDYYPIFREDDEQ